MSTHNAQKEAELEEYLKQFGYCGLFAHRADLDQATTYVTDVGKSLGNPAAVMTCVFLYVNTLLRLLHDNEQLNGAHLDIKPPSPLIIPNGGLQ